MASRREKEEKKTKRTSAASWAQKQKQGYSPTSIKLPEGVEFYKLEPGTVKVDFMPYVVGEGNPHADEGMEHFEREYTAHRVQTPDGSRFFVCRRKAWNKKCAVCDFIQANQHTAEPDLIKGLKQTTRHLWVINDKPGNENNKLKVLDTNHYNKGLGFGELLATVISSVEEYQDFWLLKGGFTANMTITEQKFPGGKFNAVNVINFLPRKYDYSPAMLKKAPCLDDCLLDPGYEEVMKLLDLAPPDEEDKEDTERELNRKSRRSKAKDDEEDTDDTDDSDDNDDDEDEAPKRRPSKSRKDEDEDDSDDDEDEPVSKKRTSKKKSSKDDEDSDDDSDSDSDDSDDEEETPRRRKSRKDEEDEEDEDEDSEDEEEDSDSDDEEDEDEAPRKRRRK